MWESHVFIWFAVIYESPIKVGLAEQLKKHKKEILNEIPNDFVWSEDHMKPETISHEEMKKGEFDRVVDRLENVKKAKSFVVKHMTDKTPSYRMVKNF